MENYYDILEINKSATPEEIKEAYRKLVKIHHPDINGGKDEKFKQISEAYSVLIDPEKRKAYDSGKYEPVEKLAAYNILTETLFRMVTDFLVENKSINYPKFIKKLETEIENIKKEIKFTKELIANIKTAHGVIKKKKKTKSPDCYKEALEKFKEECNSRLRELKHMFLMKRKLLMVANEYEQATKPIEVIDKRRLRPKSESEDFGYFILEKLL
jgi:curved DNA-binding protein CbpA